MSKTKLKTYEIIVKLTGHTSVYVDALSKADAKRKFDTGDYIVDCPTEITCNNFGEVKSIEEVNDE